MAEKGLKIAAFNIQIFGDKKMSQKKVVDIIVKIIRRYDIILIQEIRDADGDALLELIRTVNKGRVKYDSEVSKRLGRSTCKEQYAFLHRRGAGIYVKDTYQHPDRKDAFEREPFAVLLHVPAAAVSDFALVAIHVDPDEAVTELNALVPAHDKIQKHWDIDNILIMGDFNAEGRYVSKKQLLRLDLRQPGYEWLIPDTADTTVSDTDCAYDRFVMTGEDFLDSVIQGSVKVCRFDLHYGLSQEEAKKVSDHYPIELAIALRDKDHKPVRGKRKRESDPVPVEDERTPKRTHRYNTRSRARREREGN